MSNKLQSRKKKRTDGDKERRDGFFAEKEGRKERLKRRDTKENRIVKKR